MSPAKFVTFVLAGVATQVAALPAFYDENGGCEVPATAFGGHLAPVANPDVILEISDVAGTPITEWEGSTDYTITSNSYQAGVTNAWIHVSAGTITGGDNFHAQATACTEAALSVSTVPTHTFTWTAPAAGQCVEISMAQAGGPFDAYQIATTTICGTVAMGAGTADIGAGTAVTGAATPPTEAAIPTAAVPSATGFPPVSPDTNPFLAGAPNAAAPLMGADTPSPTMAPSPGPAVSPSPASSPVEAPSPDAAPASTDLGTTRTTDTLATAPLVAEDSTTEDTSWAPATSAGKGVAIMAAAIAFFTL